MGKQPKSTARAKPEQEPEPAVEPAATYSIREVKSRIEERFACFGTEECPDTVIPSGKSNNAHIAGEYFLADMLRKMADKRFKSAKQAAVEAGILGSEDEYIPGETVMTFNCPDFTINVKKGEPTRMIDRELITGAITEAVGAKKALEIVKAGEKDRAGTVTISTAMK